MSIERLFTNFKKVYYKTLPDGDELFYILVVQRIKQIEKVIGKKSDGLSPKEAYIQNNEKIKTRFAVISEKPIELKCFYCEKITNEGEIVIK